MTYREFLETKIETAPASGFDVEPAEINPALKPHQRDAVIWALHGGRRAQDMGIEMRQQWVATLDGREMTASHSEAEIYKGCISLMQELMSRFEEYLDFIGVEAGKDYDDEERFCTQFYPTEIVERLFLWHTNHSGGTSQHLKCQELGIDTDETVVFEDSRNAEE